MKNRGFTMIELVVTIAILGVLMIIALPTVNYIQANNRNKKFIAYEKAIISSSKLYTDQYSEDMFGSRNTGCAIIKYEDLKERDLIEEIQIKDTICDNSKIKSTDYKNYTYVIVRKSKNGNLNYEGVVSCRTKSSKLLYGTPNNDDLNNSCKLEDGKGPNYELIVNPKKGEYYIGDNPKTSITISDSGVGLKENQTISYQWQKGTNNSFQNISGASGTINFNNKNYKGSVNKKIPIPSGMENIDEPIDYRLVVTGTLEDVDNNQTKLEDPDNKLVIKYFVGALLIKMKAGGATMAAQHNNNYKIDSNDYIYTGTDNKYISKIKYKGSGDLFDYNDKKYINLTKSHYHIDSEKEWKKDSTEYDQKKTYKVSNFGYEDSDLIYKNQEVEVTANWKIDIHTLTYDSDGGSSCTATKAAYNSKWGDLCNPTKSGHDFLGWYDGSTQVTKDTVVTGDRKVKAKWKANAYTVTYLRNTSASDTTKITETIDPGSNYRIAYNSWSNSGKEFLGWATVANANASSTWYDEKQTYKANGNLTLYAQWYDILSLEKAYSSFTKTYSFYFHDDNLFVFSNPSIGDAKGFSYTPVKPPCSQGFRALSIASYQTSGYHRVYGVTYNNFKIRNLDATGSKYWWDQDTLFIRDNTVETNEGYSVDSRIDYIYDDKKESVKLSDIATESFTKDNESMGKGTLGGFVYKNAPNGYFYIGPAGYNISNASKDGKLTSRCYMYINTSYFCQHSDYSGSCTADHVLFNYSKSVKDITPKIKITGYMIRIKKSTDNSSYNSSSHSTKGASRYAALTDLNNAKKDYFPRSYVKRSSIITGATVSPAAWGSGTVSKSLSIPDGKILGVAEHGVSNSSGGKGESYAVINEAYISGVNNKTGTFKMTFYAGNKKYASSTGNKMTKVHGWGYAIYISSGNMTIK